MHITRKQRAPTVAGRSIPDVVLESLCKYTPKRLSLLVFNRKSTPGKKEKRTVIAAKEWRGFLIAERVRAA
jgi:hypothetical protein